MLPSYMFAIKGPITNLLQDNSNPSNRLFILVRLSLGKPITSWSLTHMAQPTNFPHSFIIRDRTFHNMAQRQRQRGTSNHHRQRLPPPTVQLSTIMRNHQSHLKVNISPSKSPTSKVTCIAIADAIKEGFLEAKSTVEDLSNHAAIASFPRFNAWSLLVVQIVFQASELAELVFN